MGRSTTTTQAPPRHLVKKQAAAIHSSRIPKELVHVSVVSRDAAPDPATVWPPVLPVGQEQLYSYFKPSLVEGLHHITVTQTITPQTGSPYNALQLSSTQDFEVLGPRFSIPEDDVHLIYPPSGHGDLPSILPHMVFNDPHLPWEREASSTTNQPNTRNRVPWLALLSFTQDELRLEPAKLASMFPSAQKQSSTWTVNMSINDLSTMQKSGSISTPVLSNTNDRIDKTTMASKYDFIFLAGSSFDALIKSYDSSGNPVASQSMADISRYQYLAHVRNINTTGMSEASTGADDQGLFSVVVSHRAGPWSNPGPTPVVVHLVSIDGVEDLSFPTTSPHVVLCSLYSWTYTCLPPGSFNCYDAMSELTQDVAMLRMPASAYQPLIASSDSAIHAIGERLQDGYSLAQWRVQTGELTMCLQRSPLVPTAVNHVANLQSTFSNDLQILDQKTGIMDVSYSAAWNLGKTLAISDQSFAAALARIRSLIHQTAWNTTKAALLTSTYRTQADVISNLRKSVKILSNIRKVSSGLDEQKKWQRREEVITPDLGFMSPKVRLAFPTIAADVAKQLAAAQKSTNASFFYYNEHNKPVSTDWALMLTWILDRMSLYGIPAHYLIADPFHLPEESIRFFLIDANWTDALVDGAMSIANHLEGDDDSIRSAIKSTVHDFLQTIDPVIGYTPQIPRSGFFMRSALVKKFPDLTVTAPWLNNKGQEPIIRKELLADDVLFVLFDRIPGDGLLTSITISQPPHQQFFAAADNVGPDTNAKDPKSINAKGNPRIAFEVAYKQIYTTDISTQPTGDARRLPISEAQYFQDAGVCSIFDWTSRCLIFPNYATALMNAETTWSQSQPAATFTDTVATSALVGIQMNEPMYQIEILCTGPTSPSSPGTPAAGGPNTSGTNIKGTNIKVTNITGSNTAGNNMTGTNAAGVATLSTASTIGSQSVVKVVEPNMSGALRMTERRNRFDAVQRFQKFTTPAGTKPQIPITPRPSQKKPTISETPYAAVATSKSAQPISQSPAHSEIKPSRVPSTSPVAPWPAQSNLSLPVQRPLVSPAQRSPSPAPHPRMEFHEPTHGLQVSPAMHSAALAGTVEAPRSAQAQTANEAAASTHLQTGSASVRWTPSPSSLPMPISSPSLAGAAAPTPSRTFSTPHTTPTPHTTSLPHAPPPLRANHPRAVSPTAEQVAARSKDDSSTTKPPTSTMPSLARSSTAAPAGRRIPAHLRNQALPIPLSTLHARYLSFSSSSPGSLAPQFSLFIHPSGQRAAPSNTPAQPVWAGPPPLPPIPTQTGYPIDLIFGVNFTGDAAKLTSLGYMFKELLIMLPVGPPTIPYKLMAYYAGGNSRMLQNLRVNPIVTASSSTGGAETATGAGAAGDVLVVTLVPRSTSGVIALDKVREMGFQLNGVDVNAYTTPQTLNIPVIEVYVLNGTEVQVQNMVRNVMLKP